MSPDDAEGYYRDRDPLVRELDPPGWHEDDDE